MANFINGMKNELNLTTTENGAVAYKSSGNALLDAFGSLCAMRESSDSEIVSKFKAALDENYEYAIKMLFYIRDIRGGQGCRRVFRVILRWLADTCGGIVIENIDNILFFGRGDDYLCLLDSSNKNVRDAVFQFMFKQINTDLNNVIHNKPCSLLAKWMPSINTSSDETRKYAKKIINAFGWSEAHYRKVLSTLRGYLRVVEKDMSANDWNHINYEAVPAKASMLYSNAFKRHDEDRYTKYTIDVALGKAKANAGSLYPYDIVHKILDRGPYDASSRIIWDAMWRNLPDYMAGRDETGICMVDTSGSMSGLPYEVAVSLGLYCADKCVGPFKNHFITFAETPSLVEVKGNDIYEKVANLRTINAGNTDIEAAFNLILRTAIDNKLSAKEIPSTLYILSDMQFDEARGARTYGWGWRSNNTTVVRPFMARMKARFAAAGYEMPNIVYWNLRQSKCGMFQQTFEGEKCCMVSGYSPSLFKSIMEGTTYVEEVNEYGEKTLRAELDPMTVMFTTLDNERYDRVVTGPRKYWLSF